MKFFFSIGGVVATLPSTAWTSRLDLGHAKPYNQKVAQMFATSLQVYNQGLARAIGVSNFLPEHLDQLQATAVVMPHVNQCEFNPLQQSPAITHACNNHSVVFTGYCPLAKGHALSHEVMYSSEVVSNKCTLNNAKRRT